AEKVPCRKGEVWTEGCVTPCPETCPPYVRQPCPFMCKLRGCICKMGYVRDRYKNNTCVPKDKCPKQTSNAAAMQRCAKGEQPSDCALLPIICQALCPNAPPTGVMCSQVCHKGCICKAGYIRDPRKSYKCVEEDKC
uniref:TIL domain-containing protein n=1 Tax=Romanomermis culicivorax TaxID=13658 RepID=A0A915JJI9_ROMCU